MQLNIVPINNDYMWVGIRLGVKGAYITLFVEKHHTVEDIELARYNARQYWDVMGVKLNDYNTNQAWIIDTAYAFINLKN